jgi:hypothetical protein
VIVVHDSSLNTLRGQGIYTRPLETTKRSPFGIERPRTWREGPYNLQMDYQEERVAKNEATSRVINEGVEAAFEPNPQDAFIFFICECGLEQCDRTVRITKAEYERVRSDARQFVIFRDHLIPDVEQVVTDGDSFLVVAKREGTPAEVAIREDPGT